VINKKSVKNIDENFLYSSVLSRELCLQLLVLIVGHDKMQLRNSVPLWFRFGSMIFLRLSGFPKKQATNIYSVFPKIPTMLYSMSSWCPIWIICRVEFGWIWYAAKGLIVLVFTRQVHKPRLFLSFHVCTSFFLSTWYKKLK
jgi:hypothetical protein